MMYHLPTHTHLYPPRGAEIPPTNEASGVACGFVTEEKEQDNSGDRERSMKRARKSVPTLAVATTPSATLSEQPDGKSSKDLISEINYDPEGTDPKVGEPKGRSLSLETSNTRATY